MMPSTADSMAALEVIIEQLRGIAKAGRLTGSTTINWRDGSPSSIQVQATSGPREGFRLPPITS